MATEIKHFPLKQFPLQLMLLLVWLLLLLFVASRDTLFCRLQLPLIRLPDTSNMLELASNLANEQDELPLLLLLLPLPPRSSKWHELSQLIDANTAITALFHDTACTTTQSIVFITKHLASFSTTIRFNHRANPHLHLQQVQQIPRHNKDLHKRHAHQDILKQRKMNIESN